MKSVKHGKSTSAVEVTNISGHGLWLFVESVGREYFLPYSEFPWFKEARIADVLAVELSHGHLPHWHALDVDLALEQLDDPKRYPLLANGKKSVQVVADSHCRATYRAQTSAT